MERVPFSWRHPCAVTPDSPAGSATSGTEPRDAGRAAQHAAADFLLRTPGMNALRDRDDALRSTPAPTPFVFTASLHVLSLAGSPCLERACRAVSKMRSAFRPEHKPSLLRCSVTRWAVFLFCCTLSFRSLPLRCASRRRTTATNLLLALLFPPHCGFLPPVSFLACGSGRHLTRRWNAKPVWALERVYEP